MIQMFQDLEHEDGAVAPLLREAHADVAMDGTVARLTQSAGVGGIEIDGGRIFTREQAGDDLFQKLAGAGAQFQNLAVAWRGVRLPQRSNGTLVLPLVVRKIVDGIGQRIEQRIAADEGNRKAEIAVAAAPDFAGVALPQAPDAVDQGVMPFAVGVAEHEPLCGILRAEDVHERCIGGAANRTAGICFDAAGPVATDIAQP